MSYPNSNSLSPPLSPIPENQTILYFNDKVDKRIKRSQFISIMDDIKEINIQRLKYKEKLYKREITLYRYKIIDNYYDKLIEEKYKVLDSLF